MTKEQRDNLKKLAIYLLSLPKDYTHFDMGVFYGDDRGFYQDGVLDPADLKPEFYEHCHTIACAVGHGPAAGIKAKATEVWKEYIKRAFGILTGSDEWYWLFSEGWGRTDNTPHGAGARIQIFLDKGIPKDLTVNGIQPFHFDEDEYRKFMADNGYFHLL